MRRTPKFDKLPNGRYFNEWYGEVDSEDKQRIIRMKMSPMDFTLWQTHRGESVDYYDAWR